MLHLFEIDVILSGPSKINGNGGVMHFPLVPLPNLLLDWYPKLQELHETSSEAFSVLCGVVGLYIIVLWAGIDPDEECPFGGTARNRMQLGFALLGAAVLSYLFGFYFVGPILLAFLMYLLYALISSARVVFFSKTKPIQDGQ